MPLALFIGTSTELRRVPGTAVYLSRRIDGSFVGANLTKVLDGGWVPLVAAAGVFTLMSAWQTGRRAMLNQLERETRNPCALM
jgi:K+ transporter